jgi:hypothetical protein
VTCHLLATRFIAPWDRLSDIGEDVVGVFMLLLFVFIVSSSCCLGIRAMFPRPNGRTKHKR